jgi:hypothetical protein
MTFLLELREAAKVQHDVLQRRLLRGAADALDASIAALHDNPVTDTMQRANSAWAYAKRLFDRTRMAEPPGTPGGALRAGAELQRAA